MAGLWVELATLQQHVVSLAPVITQLQCSHAQHASGRTKQAASALALRKEVTVKTHGHDKHKHAFGGVILQDGMNLNQELEKQG